MRRARVHRLGTLVLALVLGGGMAACSARSEGPRRPDPSSDRLENRAFDAEARKAILVERGLRVAGRTGPELRTQLGAPDAVEARPVANTHDPAVTDTILTWRYEDLELDIYRTADGRRLLARAAVSDNDYLVFPEVGVNATEAEVRRLLGEPDAATADAFEYQCGRCEGPPAPVVLTFDASRRVTRVEYFFPLD
jgi:hypothetical protein